MADTTFVDYQTAIQAEWLNDVNDNVYTDFPSHTADTSVHGVSGNVVGTSDTQTLTNKTITSPDINGGTADSLTSLSVAADSAGNVSRWVMSTTYGGIGAEDGADTWCKIAEFTPGAGSYLNFNAVYDVFGGLSPLSPFCRISVNLRQEASGLDSTLSKVDVIHALNTSSIKHDSFKLVAASATNGTTIQLWMKKLATYLAFDVYEIGYSDNNGPWSVSYNNNAAWQSATPSGAVNITSDWAGSGQLTSTSFSNGWAGTAYYEKTSDGSVTVFLNITTVGTTTDGITVFTMPTGFRHNDGVAHKVLLISTAGTAASVVGSFTVATNGIFSVYDYVTGGSNLRSATLTYRARN